MRYAKLIIWATLVCASPAMEARMLDQIVAVVEDEVILEQELTNEVASLIRNLRRQKVAIPPLSIVREQILERLIMSHLQLQLAQKSGITISDTIIAKSVEDIAARNNLSVDEFGDALAQEGITLQTFADNTRKSMTISRLLARQVGARVRISDGQIQHYLKTQGEVAVQSIQYNVGHILLVLAASAKPAAVRKVRKKANKVLADLRLGVDFAEVSAAVTNNNKFSKAGELGFRPLSQLPSLFADAVGKMKKGEVADLISSLSGIHIIKLLDIKGLASHTQTITHARHILLKTNALLTDTKAQQKLQDLRGEILAGGDFAQLATANSDDKTSAINGGDLGRVNSGDLVPQFAQVMGQLPINAISEPVQTQFGWHIIQVLAREEKDNTDNFKNNQIRQLLRKRQVDEATEIWLRRLRDESYVHIYADRL